MSARHHASAIALTLVLTAGAGALLTGCGPDDTVSSSSASSSATPSGKAPASPGQGGGSSGQSTAPSPGGKPSSSAAPVVNKTGHGLTISTGTQQVLMNGTSVDFGTVVRDLAWSPDGKKAVFIDGSGNLDIAAPDGSGRVTVAVAPSGDTWSHPTWQVPASPSGQRPDQANLVFTASHQGVETLLTVPASAVRGTPTLQNLSQSDGGMDGQNQPPQTANRWPVAAGQQGAFAYANTGTGQVYIYDDYIRPSDSPVGQGTEPALDPVRGDTSEVAFVRSTGGHDHLFVATQDPSNGKFVAKDLTPKATTDYTEPAWSPDGKTLAVRTPDGVVTLPADGSAAPTLVSSTPGLPAYHG
ncbi:hypothetical protein [Kitasatospora sp. LaBMicrA B282]|uniref:TolB family protein n=1 Tax=Kitasatospora sp. LaBMicrA B282 TaxID=3420949 RepID=UPI003D0CD88A